MFAIFLDVLKAFDRLKYEAISEMWPIDKTIRRANFTTSLTRNRFAHILEFIRFDDKS